MKGSFIKKNGFFFFFDYHPSSADLWTEMAEQAEHVRNL